MRVGQNPAKSIEYVRQPQAVTAAVISYIPFLSGYYAQSLDVLKVCLESLVTHSDLPMDLLVFDNASCPEVVHYLSELLTHGTIQYLVLSSENIGKVGAWNFIFNAAPGEYIAYSDSDIYFYPNWLSRHMQVFEVFPEAGTVCGLPRRGRRDFYTSTIDAGPDMPETLFERGKFINEDWIIDHARSLGKLDSVGEDLNKDDYRFTRNGISAYATATHFQFIVRKKTVQPFLPFPSERPMGESVAHFDNAINKNGLLRLAVNERMVKHLGNTLGNTQGNTRDDPSINQLPGIMPDHRRSPSRN